MTEFNKTPPGTPELVERLTALRRTIRRRLLIYGVCAVAAGGVAASFTIVALDWLLWLPPALRLFVTLLFVGGFVGATWHWIGSPLRASLSMSSIAARLERHFPELGDRISSAVSFVERRDAGSAAMMERVIADATAAARALPVAEALSTRPLVWRVVWLVVALAGLIAIAGAAPHWVRAGASRYLDPFGATEWPREVSIVPLTGDLRAAIGESVTVRMMVQRGWHEALRSLVYIREADAAPVPLAMRHDGDRGFSATVDSVTRELTYWFEAGDDTTKKRPYVIRVFPRPEIAEATARIEAPHYALGVPPRTHDFSDGPAVATIGETVTFVVRSTKPCPTPGESDTAGLRLENGDWIRLDAASGDAFTLSARWQVREDASFRVELRDEEGFENRGAARYAVRATPDRPPTVVIREPAAPVEVTPRGVVRMTIQCGDDFGLSSLIMNVEASGARALGKLSLSDAWSPRRGERGVDATVSHALRIEPLGASPGESLQVTFTATDNFALDGATGQSTVSSPVRLRVISETEFETRVRGDIAALETRVRQIVLEQGELRDRTADVVQRLAESGAVDDPDRERLGEAAATQLRLARRVRELSDRFGALADRLEGSGPDGEAMRERLAVQAQALGDVAHRDMPEAGTSMSRAADPAAGSEGRDHVEEAAKRQQRALDALQAVLRSMSQWGTFQGLVGKTQELMDRLNALREQTAEVGKQTLGKSLESLNEDDARKLRRAQRSQDQLNADVERMMEQMADIGREAGRRDPAAAEAVEAAMRQAKAHDMERRLRGASRAIEENRTAAAGIDQKAAGEGLRKMIAALRSRDDRELEQLRKKLDDARDLLHAMIREEEALRAATIEAGNASADASAFGALADDQRRVRGNVESLARELSESERSASAATALDGAMPPLEVAETAMRVRDAVNAAAGQDDGLTAMSDALAQLDEAARDAENEAVRRSLAQIEEGLKALRAAQMEVNDGIAALARAVEGQDRWDRAMARDATGLARRQGDTRAMLDEITPDLEKVRVYQWALERVGRWMDDIRTALDARRVDGELLATTGRIIAELDKLLAALAETQALPPNTDFTEADQGGEGQSGDSKPVPTVAELMVLRSMQHDINERTMTEGATYDPEAAGEVQLRRLRAIAEDQSEVRRLTELVTNRAREK